MSSENSHSASRPGVGSLGRKLGEHVDVRLQRRARRQIVAIRPDHGRWLPWGALDAGRSMCAWAKKSGCASEILATTATSCLREVAGGGGEEHVPNPAQQSSCRLPWIRRLSAPPIKKKKNNYGSGSFPVFSPYEFETLHATTANCLGRSSPPAQPPKCQAQLRDAGMRDAACFTISWPRDVRLDGGPTASTPRLLPARAQRRSRRQAMVDIRSRLHAPACPRADWS